MGFDYKIASKNFLQAIKDYGDTQAEQQKLTAGIMMNQIKMKQNFLYKMQEKNYQTPYQKNMQGMYEKQQGQEGSMAPETDVSTIQIPSTEVVPQESGFGTKPINAEQFIYNKLQQKEKLGGSLNEKEQKMKVRIENKMFGGGANQTPDEDVKSVSEGIMSGDIPPDSKDISFRDRTRVNAELARQGYNLSKANLEWTDMQKFIQSRESPRFQQLRSSSYSVMQALDELSSLNQEYQRMGLAPLNKLQLGLLKNGVGTPEAVNLATRFSQQLTIIQDEFANVIMTGNSPTDQALKLSGQVLNGNWNQEQLASAVDQAKKNLRYRINSFNYLQPIGVGGENRYYQKQPANMYEKQISAIPEREGNKSSQGGELKARATKELQDAGYPVTEANINAIIEQLRGK